MRDLTRLGFCCAVICTSGLVSVAFADLYGEQVNATIIRLGSPFAGDGSVDRGIFTVGDGYEYENTWTLWDYSDPDNPVATGTLTHFLDFDHESLSVGWVMDNSNGSDRFIYPLPAIFYGYQFDLIGDVSEIYGSTMEILGPSSGHIGDFDLWLEEDPKIEAMVDALWMDPEDPNRMEWVNQESVTINYQGTRWDIGAGETVICGYKINLNFEGINCLSDINGDQNVNIHDLLALVAAWGDCPDPCSADINEDQVVNIHDLLALVAAWGECP